MDIPVPRMKVLIEKINGKTSSVLTHSLLARLLKVDISTIRIRKSPNGKPFLMSPRGYSFSISHTQNIFVLALIRKPFEIGVDIEKTRSTKIVKIAERFFNPHEYEAIRRCRTRSAKLKMFFELWTIKEASVKCLGTGMFKDMKNIKILSSKRIEFRRKHQRVALRMVRVPGLSRPYVGHIVTKC